MTIDKKHAFAGLLAAATTVDLAYLDVAERRRESKDANKYSSKATASGDTESGRDHGVARGHNQSELPLES